MKKRYEDEQWKESMRITFDFNNMMADVIGEEQGITDEAISSLNGQLNAAARSMTIKRKEGKMEWRNLPYNQDEVVEDILKTASEIQGKFDAFVVLGIGGSAL
ncbi:MAG: glucose-6-phosphate isomerase, partial [Clostridiaceae bacterium]|nr:glucose-6-phosphate isomerase [Clostridiaceae bacterium]